MAVVRWARWPVLALVSFALLRWSASVPELVETAYSRGVFPVIGQGLSLLTGLVPFSVAEAIVWSLPLLGLGWLVWALWRAGTRARRAVALIATLAVALSVTYTGFVFLWGLNHSRQPFAEIAGLEVRPASVDELAALCAALIEQTNALRREVREDADGVMALNGTARDALRRAQLGYDRAAALYPVLGGRYGAPKGVLSSEWWSYTGTAGMYFPFTAEANVNIAMPDSSIPFAACHEMAHQRGFAREDEANYLGYLACRLHPDADFRYSGLLGATVHAMNQLYRFDPDRHAQLRAGFGDGVLRDLAVRSAYWQAHEGKVSEVSDRMNDRYLKAHGQADGVRSYGRMVDLLLAEFRADGGE